MTLEKWTQEIREKVQQRTTYPVYDAFDPKALEKRELPFWVVTVKTVETDTPFLTKELLCYDAAVTMTLAFVTIPQTNANESFSSFYLVAIPAMHAVGFTVTKTRCTKAEVVQRLGRMVLEGEFVGRAVFTCRKEEEVGG